MTKRFLTPISLANLSADPTGSSGAFYYNTTSNVLKYYNGSTWVTLGTSSANPGGVVFGNSLGNYTSTTAGISGQLLMSYGNISNGGPQFVSISAVESVAVATTANLTGTYANNTPGTTASTFTITATGTLTIDGYLTVLGDRILLKNQSTALQNGIYTITTAGAVGVSAVLTRDNDSDIMNKIAGVPVSVGLGTTNGGAQWVNANKTTDTLGTTSIVYNQSLNSASTTSSLTSFGTSPSLTTPNIGVATATSINKVTITAPTTSATLTLITGSTLATSTAASLTLALSSAATTVATIPSGTVTLQDLGTAQSITGVKTFSTAPVISTITNTGTITLPTSTDTLVGRTTTDTLTNKTLTAPKINLTLNAQTGTTYTFVLGDNGQLVTASNASAQTYSIPTNASVAFPVGTQINIIQIGAGQVTIQAVTSGTTTVASTGGTATAPKLRAQYSSATLIKAATDLWYVVGDIV